MRMKTRKKEGKKECEKKIKEERESRKKKET